MKTNVAYKCSSCDLIESRAFDVGSQIPTSIKCEKCNSIMPRVYGDVSIDKQPDSVSFATSTMLYGKLPSGRERAVL
jgi:DNA-directed RNA polymerase subunit RPC12/RpoP